MDKKFPTDQEIIDWLNTVNNREVARNMGLKSASRFSRIKAGNYNISDPFRFAIWAYWVIYGGPEGFDRSFDVTVKGEIKA